MKLSKRITATLEKSPAKGGSTYVVMPGSAEYFGTRGQGFRRVEQGAS